MKHNLTHYTFADNSLTGLYAAPLPKHAARGREEDSLFMLLLLSDRESVPETLLQEWYKQLAEIFYRASGSVTSAMRAVVEGINVSLIEKNNSENAADTPLSGSIFLGVVHHNTLFAAQAGSCQMLVSNAGGYSLFYDEEVAQQSLGTSQVPALRFYQADLTDKNWIFLSAQFPASWMEGDLPIISDDPEKFQKLLETLDPQSSEIGFVLIEPGEGAVQQAQFPAKGEKTEAEADAEPFSELDSLPEASQEVELSVQDENQGEVLELTDQIDAEDKEHVPQAEVALETELGFTAEDIIPNEEETEQQELTVEMPADLSDDQTELIETESTAEVVVADTVQTPEITDLVEQRAKEAEARRAERLAREAERERQRAERIAERERKKVETYREVADGAARVNGFGAKLTRIFSRKAVEQTDISTESVPLSSGTKLLLSIVIPLVVAIIGSSIYINKGREDQYQYLMAQARAAVSNAAQMKNPADQREGWDQAFDWLDKAAAYRQTDEIRALRVQAQNAVDQLDGAIRLEYSPVLQETQLPTLQIKRIVTVGTDAFILDSTTGVVLRINLTNNAYALDVDFTCQPGNYDGIAVGKLIEMTAIPITNPAGAPILGIDAQGNMLYCAVGKEPKAAALKTPPGGFGEIRSIMVDSQRLLILDPKQNSLWLYRGFSTFFDAEADSYFEEPYDLGDVTDFAVGSDELFLLYADGHTAHCLASVVTGTVECDNPYPYQDTRPGAEVIDLDFGSLKFGKLSYSPPPDPSLYFLDPETAELYQFSLRLNLNRVLRSASASGVLPNRDVTAFNVSSNRRVFLAFGNSLFEAKLP